MTTSTSMTETDRRAEYVAGLRAIADALDADPALPLPYHGANAELGVFCYSKAEAVAYARLMTSTVDKHVDESANFGFQLIGKLHGLALRVYIDRGEVCERVVTGTREVVKAVPDPDGVVPLVERTVVVEDVEWVCSPLLAEVTR